MDGILGVKVEAKEATGVAKTAFTANWTELHNADKYKLNVIKILEAKEDVKDVVVLHEDFNAIDQGTMDNPYNPYNRIQRILHHIHGLKFRFSCPSAFPVSPFCLKLLNMSAVTKHDIT